MPDDENIKIVPIPGSDTQSDHDRVRKSNDRDQQAERDGEASRHNEGYDEAADGVRPDADIVRVVDE